MGTEFLKIKESEDALEIIQNLLKKLLLKMHTAEYFLAMCTVEWIFLHLIRL